MRCNELAKLIAVLVPDSAYDIVCCLLGRVWNRPYVLVLSFVYAQLPRAVEQRRSSLQIFLIIFAHFLFVLLIGKKELEKNEKLRSGSQFLNCVGPVQTLFKLKKNSLIFRQVDIFLNFSIDLDYSRIKFCFYFLCFILFSFISLLICNLNKEDGNILLIFY